MSGEGISIEPFRTRFPRIIPRFRDTINKAKAKKTPERTGTKLITGEFRRNERFPFSVHLQVKCTVLSILKYSQLLSHPNFSVLEKSNRLLKHGVYSMLFLSKLFTSLNTSHSQKMQNYSRRFESCRGIFSVSAIVTQYSIT